MVVFAEKQGSLALARKTVRFRLNSVTDSNFFTDELKTSAVKRITADGSCKSVSAECLEIIDCY